MIIRIVSYMLWCGIFIHAGPNASAGFWMELSCIPVVTVIDTDGAAFTNAGQDSCLLRGRRDHMKIIGEIKSGGTREALKKGVLAP